ncbi:MAG: thioredoxin [Candidatus Dojkabacteria bacterium]
MSLLHLTDSNFQEEVLDFKGLVLVDFWAEWCGPCRILGPVIEELAEDMGEKVKVCKMDVDAQREIAGKYGIMSIPTVMLFKDGELVETLIGLRDKGSFVQAIEDHS